VSLVAVGDKRIFFITCWYYNSSMSSNDSPNPIIAATVYSLSDMVQYRFTNMLEHMCWWKNHFHEMRIEVWSL